MNYGEFTLIKKDLQLLTENLHQAFSESSALFAHRAVFAKALNLNIDKVLPF
jgi:hypothetical protein